MSEIIYRSYNKKNDYLLQRKLFELSFPEAIGTPAISDQHYSWKFEKFPASISAYEYIADESLGPSKELVGYYAALPFTYKIGLSDKVECGMVCDVMTHPDRRGKGIFTKIGAFATEDLKRKGLGFVTGYPIRPEVIPGHLKVGWKVVQKMPMYFRPLGVTSFLPKSFRFISKLVNPILRGAQFFTHLGPRGYSTKILSVNEFLNLDEGAEFLNTWLSQQQNALIKSKDFLKWRTSAPETQYYFVCLNYKNSLVGYSLIRPTTLKGVECIAVLDIAILKEHFRGSYKIHSEIAKLAVSLAKDVVVCISSKKWAKKYHFFGALYIPTPSVFSLIVKKLDERLKNEDLYQSDPWHLFWIDSDDL
jgi:GNAT superfamily N-acetyltransferase